MEGKNEGFLDAEEFHGMGSNNPLSFQFIVMEQVRRIAQLGSVEFRGGYWEYTNKQNAPEEKYIPASHESFSEAVLTLSNLLWNYLDEGTHNKIKKEYEKINSRIKEIEREAKQKVSDNAYRKIRAQQSRSVFRILCGALKDMNYLEGAGIIEGAADE